MRMLRPKSDLFDDLPKADPLAKDPIANKEAKPGEKAVETLLPSIARQWLDSKDVGDTPADGEESDFDNKHWDEFLDGQSQQETSEAQTTRKTRLSKLEKKDPIRALFKEKFKNGDAPTVSPLAVVEAQDVNLKSEAGKELSAKGHGTSMERLRAVGLAVANRRAHNRGNTSSKPVFHSARAEGMSTADIPLPGTSAAIMGLRPSMSRYNVTTATAEADRLFSAREDLRHGSGVGDLRTAALDWDKAKRMLPGERFKLATQQTVVVETGLKYTPTFVPGVSSSMFHDLGVSGSADFTVGVDCHTSVEVVRGFRDQVAVTVSVKEKSTKPNQDREFKLGVGAFFDASIPEYAAQAFSKVAGQRVDDELRSMETRRKETDLTVTPLANKFNDHAATYYSRRKRDNDENIHLYEVVLDLSKPKAREAFDSLVGAGSDDKDRVIDFAALEGLSAEDGVNQVSNNIRHASRRGIEKTFSFFGLLGSRSAETHIRSENASATGTEIKRTVEETFATEKTSNVMGTQTQMTLLGRIKSVPQDDGSSHSGVGLGMRYHIDAERLSIAEAADLLAFAAESGSEPGRHQELDRLLHENNSLPSAKLLGFEVGPHTLGKTSCDVEFELNKGAVQQLLDTVSDDDSQQLLWDRLASAYARRHGLDTPPTWPNPRLTQDSIMGRIRRSLFTFSAEDDTFVAASNAILALKGAKNAESPVERAEKLRVAFGLLQNEMSLAGALVDIANQGEKSGVHVQVDLGQAQEAINSLDPHAIAADSDALPQES